MDDIFNKGIVAYICHDEDYTWQNMKDYEYFKLLNKPREHLKLIPSPFFSNDMIVDIEQNPGHSHIVNHLWFGSSLTDNLNMVVLK